MSLWPAESGATAKPVRSVLRDYNHDCVTEGRAPDGKYTIEVSQEEADKLIKSINEIKRQIAQQTLQYSFLNQKAKNSYNCSGIVERVLQESNIITFGNPEMSNPNTAANTIRNHQRCTDKEENPRMQAMIQSTFGHIRARL